MGNKLLELKSLIKSIRSSSRTSFRIFEIHFGRERRQLRSGSLLRLYRRALSSVGVLLLDWSAESVVLWFPVLRDDSQLHQAALAAVRFFFEQNFEPSNVEVRLRGVRCELYNALPVSAVRLSFFLAIAETQSGFVRCMRDGSTQIECALRLCDRDQIVHGEVIVSVELRRTGVQIAASGGH